MTVHHIINSYSLSGGGSERLVRALHCQLFDRAGNSRLLGLERFTDDRESGAQTLGCASAYSVGAFVGVWRYLRGEVKTGDVVHAHLFPTSLYVSACRRLRVFSAATVFTEHSTCNSRRGTWWGAFIDRLTYGQFDTIIAISNGVMEELVNWLPTLQRRTTVIANGIPLAASLPRKQERSGKLVILSVGGLREAKNYATMLRAIAALESFSFEYWIAGDGILEKQLKKLAVDLGIDGRVRFLGRVADVNTLLACTDIFLMASAWEGFGIAAVEAMDAGVPVVASDVPGLREVVSEDAGAALLVDPKSVEEIAGALSKLLSSIEMRQSLGKAGYCRAKAFSIERMVEAHIRVYEQLGSDI